MASSALANKEKSRYGSNTSCMTLTSNGQVLVIDAGSGLAQFFVENKENTVNTDILISHLHLDHIIGLTGFPPIWNPNSGTKIFTLDRGSGSIKERVFGVFKPPYWPVPMPSMVHAECVALEADKTIESGNFKITPFMASHGNKTTSFYITDGKNLGLSFG